MYRLNPTNIQRIIVALERAEKQIGTTNRQFFKDELETFKSIYAVMGASNQDYVYILGRDPNKI